MREYCRLNYLHYGDALPLLVRYVDQYPSTALLKSNFLAQTFNGSLKNPFLTTILSSYGEPQSKKLCPHELTQDVLASQTAHRMFESLGCRGFSHAYVSDLVGFPYRLRKQVDLRVAIISGRDLFYPKRVRRYLQRHTANHYFVDNYPAIAFALGRRIGRKWYISIVQSDIAFSSVSYMREHFRGWRKVLFAAILRHAANEADAVYLCPATQIMEGSFRHGIKPARIPNTWEQIYDRTASDFGMKPVVQQRAVNMQIYSIKQPVYCRSFYELQMTDRVVQKTIKQYEHTWKE